MSNAPETFSNLFAYHDGTKPASSEARQERRRGRSPKNKAGKARALFADVFESGGNDHIKESDTPPNVGKGDKLSTSVSASAGGGAHWWTDAYQEGDLP